MVRGRHAMRGKSRAGNVFLKDTLRMWAGNWKRFVSIAVIAMLGVAVLVGMYAGCQDMFRGASRLYEEQRYYDVQIVSTAGLTDADLRALRQVDGVQSVQGEHMQAAQVSVKGSRKSVTLTALGSQEISRPYVLRGSLPKRSDQIAVTEQFVADSGLDVGDTVTLSADSQQETGEPADGQTGGQLGEPADGQEGEQSQAVDVPEHATISAVVIDLNDLSNPNGYAGVAFRKNAASDYSFFTMPTDVGAPYAAASILVDVSNREQTFNDVYEREVNDVVHRIERNVQQQREQARHDELVDQAVDMAAARIAAAQATSTLDRASVEASVPAVTWYVNTRATTGSYSTLKSDVQSIESLGRVFPVVFVLVAVLMSLTAMTRMVEEDRGLIGTYLALGFGHRTIALRYLGFALLACLIGAGVGDLVGFLGIPAFLLVVLQGLYLVPTVSLQYDWAYGSIGVLIFVVGIGIATVIACWNEVRHTPATLMRPKAPKAGSRVLLEYCTPLWRRMSFLNKVTARNLFRFKGRLLMTIGGVAGCTALIVCGMAINDTVDTLGARQYHDIDHYDMLVVTDPGSFESLRERIADDGKATHTLPAEVINGDMSIGGEQSADIQLVVIDDADAKAIGTMMSWRSVEDHESIRLADNGIIVTQSAGNSLGIRAGDTVTVRGDGVLGQRSARVAAVSRNLIGSNVYISAAYYRQLFGEDMTPNALYATLRGSDTANIDYVDTLAHESEVLSATSTAQLLRDFTFDLMSAVVALIIGLAGGLALVVLFTLANTNISERVREMATLKVLGFFNREVHVYVHKEMLILTIMGIAVGLPLGAWIAGWLTEALAMPSLYFAVYIAPTSYLIAAGVTFLFALIVQWLTNPALDRIDPVSSLKSVE